MKAFILGPKNRHAYCPNRRVDRTQVAKIEGNQSGEPRADRQARSQRHSAPASTTRAEPQQNRKPRTEAAIGCYVCDGRGHFAKECPTRLRKEKKLSDSPGRKTPSERSHVPGDKRETRTSGNENEA